jgi:imidazolonepropionase-like amidohydrolase
MKRLALVADRVFTARSDRTEPAVVVVEDGRIADVVACAWPLSHAEQVVS